MVNIKQGQQMIPIMACEIPFVKMSASWFLVSMYLIWIFGVQINSIEQPTKSNSVSSGKMSHCKAPPFHNHFNYSFIVLKYMQ